MSPLHFPLLDAARFPRPQSSCRGAASSSVVLLAEPVARGYPGVASLPYPVGATNWARLRWHVTQDESRWAAPRLSSEKRCCRWITCDSSLRLAGALRGEAWTPTGMRIAMRRLHGSSGIHPGECGAAAQGLPRAPRVRRTCGMAPRNSFFRATSVRTQMGVLAIRERRHNRPACAPWNCPSFPPSARSPPGSACRCRLFWLADPAGRNRLHPKGPLRTYRYCWIPRAASRGSLKFQRPASRRSSIILTEILNAVPARIRRHWVFTRAAPSLPTPPCTAARP